MNARKNMDYARGSGILLHITSLPGRYGIGELGTYAYRFVDWLVQTKQSFWQVLPLNPTSYGDSPYSSPSAFAGNHLLIDLEQLVNRGWLTADDLNEVPRFPSDTVDYGAVIDYRINLLKRAHEAFARASTDEDTAQFEIWKVKQGYWLNDYALFMALKEANGGRPFTEWEKSLIVRNPDALDAARKLHAEAISYHTFWQWVFFDQWHRLKTYANQRGIRIIGDMPIYTASDCSEVWARPHLFHLDTNGYPTVVGGVPPDYFSATGQRWGNPLFDWDAHSKEDFQWWVERFKTAHLLYDTCRIDGFRQLEAYWEIPASEETAIRGQWVSGPGQTFFDSVFSELPDMQLIAEDLGLITESVERLRDDNKLPGMTVLQFAWSDLEENSFLPHHNRLNQVVYTGTHDNNTVLGWWESGEASQDAKQYLSEYIGTQIVEPQWELIRLAMISSARICIIPMQDILGVNSKARMNTPGRVSENWSWRMTEEHFERVDTNRLAQMTTMYARKPASKT